MYLPDRGRRRKCDRDAESNNERRKDDFWTHRAASHFSSPPCGDMGPRRSYSNPENASTASKIEVAAVRALALGDRPLERTQRCGEESA
jgi:hypothetical protein